MEQITLKIEGMACAMCESHICDCIRNSFKIKKVTASRRNGNAVILTETPIPRDALCRAIEDMGYTVTSVSSEPFVKKKFFWQK